MRNWAYRRCKIASPPWPRKFSAAATASAVTLDRHLLAQTENAARLDIAHASMGGVSAGKKLALHSDKSPLTLAADFHILPAS